MSLRNDDRAIIEAGYKPQLKRSLGFFSSFAIPFSVISITTGIFANYGFVLTKAGPFGFWTWLMVSLGRTMVALVLGEMAGRIPLAGSVYNWNNKLVNPVVGWFTGWMVLSNFAIAVAAVTTTMVPVLGVIIGHDIDVKTGCYLSSALIIIQMLINVYGVRLTSHTNIIAVLAEIIGIIGLSCLIIAAVFYKGHFDYHLLTTVPTEPRPYWPDFMMCALLGAWTMGGFESSADVSEETLSAKTVTPKAMVLSVIASAILGFFFIVIMTLAIPDLATISKASYPLAAITSYYLGDGVTNLFMAFALVAIFSCSLVCMTAGSRLIFAMARDGRFIAAPFFSRVSSHHVPKGAIIAVAFMGILFTFMTDSATSLYGACTVLACIYYLITVVAFAIR